MSVRPRAIALLTLFVVAGGLVAAPPTMADSGNLLANGGAELGEGTLGGYDAVTVPGWEVSVGLPTVVAYGVAGFPDGSSPGSPGRGGNFFAGGTTKRSTLVQVADLAAAAPDVDGGTVAFTFSGWLGGYAAQNDKAIVQLTFQDATGRRRRRVRLRPVSAGNRGRVTGFVQRIATGVVPAGSRSARVEVMLRGSSGYNDGYVDDLSLTISAPLPAAPPPAPPVATVPAFDHVFLIVLENKDYGSIVGNVSDAPFLNSLLSSSALAANYFAVVHPSDPNYVAIAAGSVHGLLGNDVHGTTIAATHLGDLLEAAGRTWMGYAEGMNGPCDTTDHYPYYVDSLPFYFFANVRTAPQRCQAHLAPLTQLFGDPAQPALPYDLQSAATTPHFVWFEPDVVNEMHDGTIAVGDAWLASHLPQLFASPAWQTERSLLFVTWDEDDFHPAQHVATIVVGSAAVRAGYRSPVRYTHYSLLRTIEAALGLPSLTPNDTFATPMNDLFH